MYQLQTEKQKLYFSEVIRLHYEEGLGCERISRLLPVGHTTAARWISIYEKEKGKISGMKKHVTSQAGEPEQSPSELIHKLQEENKALKAELQKAEIKAAVYDKMIDLAEARFNIPIRKKPGAKQ